jgi:hypothetical protein
MLSNREIRFLIHCVEEIREDVPDSGSGCKLEESEVKALLEKLEMRAASAKRLYDGIKNDEL